MSDSVKRQAPGGKTTTTAKAYCDAWRKYAEPVAEFMGWRIHSFGPDIKFVSEDYKHTQLISIPFIEDLYDAIQKGSKCKTRPPQPQVSSSNAQSSSGASQTPPKRPASRPSSTGPNTRTFDTKEASSKQGR
jgi:hypothetical protein